MISSVNRTISGLPLKIFAWHRDRAADLLHQFHGSRGTAANAAAQNQPVGADRNNQCLDIIRNNISPPLHGGAHTCAPRQCETSTRADSSATAS